ncbi:hypothetical protein GIB67_016171 [Kingdonia uniflora]|uniref:Uncharacterized protein n=1 Tax=Kingdonia uniflora TaxID=39325 RepID=A0A7J7N9B6_9MAGN|nr:hypothetical protein GIB67_016171 [Kingdonia uniflora]
MVKTRSMVLEERITSETQRLKLKYFGDLSLEVAIPAPVPPTYQGLLGDEVVKAEEDFYYKQRFHIFALTGEERWASFRTLAEDRVENVPVESVYKMGSSSANEVLTFGLTNKSDNEGVGGLEQFPGFPDLEMEKQDRGIDESISLEYFDGDVRSDLSEGFLCYLFQLKYGLSLPLTNLAKGIMNAIGVKGNCIQRDDEEPLDLQFRTVKQSVKSTVERKKFFLDEVAEEETELELVLEGLGLSRKKRVDSKSDKVTKEKRRVESSGEKVAEVRPAAVDDLREVEERARLAALHGGEDTSKMVARLVKGIWIGIEEEKSELKKAKSKLEKDLAKVEANQYEMVEECDGLGRHLMLTGYSEEEVDAIKANTCVEEGEDEEAEVVKLDSSRAREDNVLMCNREFAEQFNRMKECDDLNKRVARLKAEKDQTISRAKKAEAREHSWGSKTEVKAPLVRRDAVSLSGRIRELESDVSHIQGNVQNGNANLRECQYKLDATLIREKVLEGEIKAKESLVKRNEELLKDLLAREELNLEIGKLHPRVVDLEALNLAESAKYIAKLEEDVIYHDKVDAEIL